jgi:aminomethyltransferase
MTAPPAARPRLLTPGLLTPDPGLERFWVRPGGATALVVEPGDAVTVTDEQGRQAAELTVLAPDGREDFAALGTAPDGVATVLRALTRAAAEDGSAALAELAARGLDPYDARATVLFGEWSPAGASARFEVERQVLVVVAAPGERMAVDEQNPPSDLTVEIRKAAPRAPVEPVLPPPLAEPILDLRVDRATARSYEVAQGQFIQIIDVEGRQCSDFLAFRRKSLEEGVERGLDSTATRYFMGNAFPQPGLYSKFFDQDMRPLVEVVQDTVGRHDTFGLACNTKYYEDFGYFGHVNCTDNFNRELDPYGIAPRRGWPALNFFYNTFFDDDFLYFFDEPWSRPGDYVLLRAATDLVCSSSACPDDIDPANAWNPTDVHVRVYPAEERFQVAVAHRVTPDARPRLSQQTGFHPRTSALTQRFTEYRGYWLPAAFDNHGTIEEYWACREHAAVMDLSPLRKFEVLGPDAEALLQATVTRDMRRLAVGQVTYTALCHETGGMIDDATVFRLGDNNFRFVGGDEHDGVWLREQAERLGLDRVWVKHSTDQLHNLAVQGPRSRELLAPLLWTAPTQPRFEDLGWFRFAVARLGDAQGLPLVVSRTGYTGELGYELWCHPDDAPALWDAVWEAGRPHGLAPLGLDALDVLRIEAGLVFADYEFDDTVDPFEAGIGFAVPLRSKQDDFVGRAALERRAAAPQRTLVGLELEGNEPAGHGDTVHVGRYEVGTVTSGTRSPVLRRTIALCRIAIEHSEPGTAVEVGKLDGQQQRIPATVVALPFYDPDKQRVRS